MLSDCTNTIGNRQPQDKKAATKKVSSNHHYTFSFSDDLQQQQHQHNISVIPSHQLHDENDPNICHSSSSQHDSLKSWHQDSIDDTNNIEPTHNPSQPPQPPQSENPPYLQEQPANTAHLQYRSRVQEQLQDAERSLSAYRDRKQRLTSKQHALKQEEKGFGEKQRHLIEQVGQFSANSRELSEYSSQMQKDLQISAESREATTTDVTKLKNHLANQTTAHHKQQLDQLKSMVDMKQTSITLLEQKIVLMNAETAELHRTLADKIAETSKMEIALSQKDLLIINLNASLTLLEQKQVRLQQQLQQQQLHVTNAQTAEEETNSIHKLYIAREKDQKDKTDAQQSAFFMRIASLEQTIQEKCIESSNLTARVIDLENELKAVIANTAAPAIASLKHKNHEKITINPLQSSLPPRSTAVTIPLTRLITAPSLSSTTSPRREAITSFDTGRSSTQAHSDLPLCSARGNGVSVSCERTISSSDSKSLIQFGRGGEALNGLTQSSSTYSLKSDIFPQQQRSQSSTTSSDVRQIERAASMKSIIKDLNLYNEQSSKPTLSQVVLSALVPSTVTTTTMIITHPTTVTTSTSIPPLISPPPAPQVFPTQATQIRTQMQQQQPQPVYRQPLLDVQAINLPSHRSTSSTTSTQSTSSFSQHQPTNHTVVSGYFSGSPSATNMESHTASSQQLSAKSAVTQCEQYSLSQSHPYNQSPSSTHLGLSQGGNTAQYLQARVNRMQTSIMRLPQNSKTIEMSPLTRPPSCQIVKPVLIVTRRVNQSKIISSSLDKRTMMMTSTAKSDHPLRASDLQ